MIGPAVPSIGEAARSAHRQRSPGCQRRGRLAVSAAAGARRRPAARARPGRRRARQGSPHRAGLPPLSKAGGSLLETLAAHVEHGRSLEAAARVLYVHPNTVRYRLRKVAEVTGWDPLDARESFVLAIALAVGRLDVGFAPLGGAPARVVESAQPDEGSLSPSLAGRSARARQSGRVLAIVCPGQGSQTPGFLAPWLELAPLAERITRALRRRRAGPCRARHHLRRGHHP